MPEFTVNICAHVLLRTNQQCYYSLSQLEEENVINIEEERASCERRCAEIYADRLKAFCRQAHKTQVSAFSDSVTRILNTG